MTKSKSVALPLGDAPLDFPASILCFLFLLELWKNLKESDKKKIGQRTKIEWKGTKERKPVGMKINEKEKEANLNEKGVEPLTP